MPETNLLEQYKDAVIKAFLLGEQIEKVHSVKPPKVIVRKENGITITLEVSGGW